MSMYELEENGIQQIQSSSDVRKGKAVSYTVTAG